MEQTNTDWGAFLTARRQAMGLSQRELADRLGVTDKAVSKWENGRGRPDSALLVPLAAALGVSPTELLSGERTANRNRSGNFRRARFYVCPDCGNVLLAAGEGDFSCCGRRLAALEPHEPDGEHALRLSSVEDEWLLTMEHPMEKTHFITFAAFVGDDGAQLRKLYPEQDMTVRLPRRGHGDVLVCCSRHGLFRVRV